MYIYTHIFAYTPVFMYVHVYIYIYASVYTFIHICVSYISVYTYMLYMFTYIKNDDEDIFKAASQLRSKGFRFNKFNIDGAIPTEAQENWEVMARRPLLSNFPVVFVQLMVHGLRMYFEYLVVATVIVKSPTSGAVF